MIGLDSCKKNTKICNEIYKITIQIAQTCQTGPLFHQFVLSEHHPGKGWAKAFQKRDGCAEQYGKVEAFLKILKLS